MEIVYFDRDGNEIDLDRFAELCEDDSYIHVGDDNIGDVRVSTVWLAGTGIRIGTNNLLRDQPGYETMVFAADGGIVLCNRYWNRAAAIDGHAAVVGLLRELGDALKEALPKDVGDV